MNLIMEVGNQQYHDTIQHILPQANTVMICQTGQIIIMSLVRQRIHVITD